MKTKYKLLTITASLLACGLGVSANANANAYAVATDNIRNGSVFIGVDTGTDGIPDTINAAAINVASPPASVSATSATLNGFGGSSSCPGACGPNMTGPDALPSIGTGSPARGNEDVTGAYYNLFGYASTQPAYSWGDAIVNTEQTLTGTPIVARNAAESNIPGTGSAASDARNSSSTAVIANINAGSDCNTLKCAISFSFDADPYIHALLDNNAGPGSVARGVLTFNITLTQHLAGGGTVTVFDWAPDGKVVPGGVIPGGTEQLDAESLNLTREALLKGQDSEYSGPYAGGFFGSYFAYTNYLLPGSYTLSISMSEATDVLRTVPEPGSLALLGLGLTGLAVVRRRKWH